MTLPDFFRTETWHPLVVHFPLVLLLVASVFKIISMGNKDSTWHLGGSILLSAGVIMAWAAIYTGDMADGIVSRAICDPTVLASHENNAYVAALVFSAAAIVDVFRHAFSAKKRRFMLYAVAVMLVIGSGFLTVVGHLGATLVYQQAAGVYVPSEDCSEFD